MFNETMGTRLSRLLSGPNKWFCLDKGSAKKKVKILTMRLLLKEK